MTTSAAPLRADSTGNGSGLNHPYTWKIDSASELLVTKIETATNIETTLTLDVDYDVTGIGNISGGNVVISPALPSGYSLVILPNVDYSQTADFTNQNSVPPEEIEGALDRLSTQIKQIFETVSRAITIPLSNTDTNALTLVQTILGYKTSAEAAKIGAELAQTGANSAEADTLAALSAAEAARDATLAALDSVALEVISVTNADSPVTAVVSKFYSVDTTAGAVVINLPSIAVAGNSATIAVRKTSNDANTVTVNGDGTDTIDLGASYVIQAVGNVSFLSNDAPAPDNWVTTASGGGLAEKKVDNFVEGVDFDAGTDNTITLSFNPGSENALAIMFDGVTQHHTEFSVSGTTVTFTETIPLGVQNIEARYDVSSLFGVANDASVTWAKLASSVIATAADITSGVANKIISAANFKTWFDSRRYTSAPTVFTETGQTVFTHGLGATPRTVNFHFVCTTSEGGYSIGDEIDIVTCFDQNVLSSGLYYSCYAFWKNATEIGFSRINNTIYGLYLPTKLGTGVFTMTPSSWRIVGKAEL